ncbi:MAG: hypothetical protein XD93_0281 [candidate division WS6 bacterium 34_10]|uniref:Fibrinogen C-terminal domain-containing protein n=1 Tax=candidate division WS6 bacterium 34_10 TaxID=1641389 RepID=A0A124FXB4_9BACT|nr:MAG: hypothetical protein XD93_0281 [candidate division WS6 bacterium 34_10]
MNKNLKKTIRFLKKNRELVLKTIIPVVIFCATVIIMGIATPKPNDNISPSNNGYLFENRNPKFNVGFGNKDDPKKQYVRFEANLADNPFEEKEESFWNSFTKSFKSKKGFEFGLSEIRFSETESNTGKKLVEQLGTAIEQMELDSISTNTEVIEVGRVLGEEDSDNISKKTVINKDVYPGIDVEYQILEGLGVKEEIVIRNIDEYTSQCGADRECLLPLNEFVFDLKLDEGVELKESMVSLRGKTENKYYLTDDEGNYIAHFLPTFAVDGVGAKTTDVDLDITQVEGNDYKVRVILNLDWLFSNDRVFPIRIDPSIVHDTTTEFDTGSDYNTEVVTGPKIQLEGPEANDINTDLKGYWKFDDEITSIVSTSPEAYWDLDEPSGSGAYLLDKTNGNHDATPIGTTSTIGKIRYGRSFNGTTSDYISVPHSSGFSFDRTTHYTLEAWIKTSSTATQRIMAKLNQVAPYTGYDIAIVNNKIRTHLIGTWSTSAIQVDGSTTVTDGKWHHVVVTYDGSSSASGIKIYVDGALETPTVGNNNLTTSTTNTTPFTIGLRNNGDTPFNGLIDEVVLYSMDLTSSEVLSRYREGLDIKDSSGNNNHGTGNGYGTAYVNNAKVGTAIEFDGDASGDHVNGGPVTNYSATTALTVSAWVYADSAPTTQGRTAVSTYEYVSSSENYGWNFGAIWTTPRFEFHICDGGTADNIVYDPTYFSENIKEWVHYVGVYSGSNYLRLYKNGKMIDEQTTGVASSISYYTGTDLIFGRRSVDAQSYWDGALDEVRVYNTAIGEDEVERLYSLGIEEKVSGAHTSASLDTDSSSSDIESITWTAVGNDTGDGETPYSTTNLIAQWDFNESSGTTADNEGSCGSSCDGTLYNMTTTGQDVGMGTGWTSDKRRWGNGALMFDGSNDYVTVPSNTDLRPYAGFSIEAWINTDQIGEVQQIIAHAENGGGDDGWGLRIQGTGKISFNGSNASGWYPNVIESDTIVKPGEWYHVVGVYTPVNLTNGLNELKIYVNGVLENTKDVDDGVVYSVTDYVNIGRRGGTFNPNSNFFDGTIDSLRFYTRELSETEILSNYQSGNIEMRYRTSNDGSTWSDWSGTETAIDSFDDDYLYDTSLTGFLSYWPMEESSGTTVEDVGYTNEGTASGAYITDGKFGNGRTFDGVDDYISIPDNSSLQLSSGLTLELWFKSKEVPPDWIIPVRKDTETGTRYLYGFGMDNTSGGRIYGQYYNGTNFIATYSGSDIYDGQWHHAAMTISGTTLKFYFDGTYRDSVTISGTQGVPTGELNIGASPPWTGGGRGHYFEGSIDEVRISNTVATDQEIAERWAVGSSNATSLRTKPMGNHVEGDGAFEMDSLGTTVDANTVGYWKLDEGGTLYRDSSSYSNNSTSIVGTTYVKNGKVGSAVSFDGTDDKITVGTSGQSSNNFTVEAWFTTNVTHQIDTESTSGVAGTSGQRYLFGAYNPVTPSTDAGMGVSVGTNGISVYEHGPSYMPPLAVYSGNVPRGWNHLAVVYENKTPYIYLNGELVKIGLTSTKTNVNPPKEIGGGSYGYHSGMVDEVRISNRVRTSEEIMDVYKMGKNEFVSRDLPNSNDISDSRMLPFWVASDQLGNNFDFTFGGSSYANYEPDYNTVGLWGMEDGASVYPKDCSEIRSYGVTTSKVYAIDPDGPGGSAAFNAYCNMTYDGGGWTLLDNFVSSLSGDSDPYGAAIGYSNIRSKTDLTTAGYAYYLSHVENTYYPRQTGYLQMYYSTTAEVGYIQKTLPSYADEIYVKWGNWHSPSTIHLIIGGITVQTLGTNYGASVYQGSYNAGDVIRFQESGIFWVGEIWVRDSDADKYVSIEDRSGYGNDGISMGATSGDGVIGDGRYFDGEDDYITIPHSSAHSFERTDSFTIEAWVKTSSSNTFQEVIAKMNNAAPYRGYDLSVYEGVLHFMLINTWDTNCLVLHGTTTINDGNWHHIGGTYDGSSSASGARIYIDGKRESTTTYRDNLSATIVQTEPVTIGMRNGQSGSYFDGSIDEVRISNTVRSADDIRQAHEVGRRTHPINVDFKASLQSSNLISSSGDTSFTISEQDYGTVNHIENIDVGEKIVVKENIGGTEYIAQGNLTTVNTGTGAVTVSSWDTGSTFPTSGFTVNATVFKWQREYIDIRYPLDEDINGITQLTFRKNTDAPATFWIDDAKKATYSSDYNASSFTPIEGIRYIQYQPIFTKWDSNPNLDLYLTEVDITYTSGPTNEQLMRHGKWFDSSGVEQPFWWVGNESPQKKYYTLTLSNATLTCGFPAGLGVTSSTVVEGGNASPELSCSGSGTFCGFIITSGACAGTFSGTTGSCSDVWQDITIEGGYYPSACPW